MTNRQLKRQSEYYTMFMELKRIESPNEAKALMIRFSEQQRVKFGTVQNKVYDLEKEHGTCDWRQDERQTPADYCEKGVCLMCKRATGNTVPMYANGARCFACNDTGYYTEAVMNPERVNASQRAETSKLRYSLMHGCVDYDEYTFKCRGASITPLKLSGYKSRCVENGGTHSPSIARDKARDTDITATLNGMGGYNGSRGRSADYVEAILMLSDKYSLKQSTVININRTLKRKSREGRRS